MVRFPTAFAGSRRPDSRNRPLAGSSSPARFPRTGRPGRAAAIARAWAAVAMLGAWPGVSSCSFRDVAAPEVRPATVEEILEVVREPGARAVLVNVWATWCAPCREEFPDLMRIRDAYRARGLRLVLISADFADQLPAARTFLSRHGVDFLTYLKRGDDMHFIDTLSPKWTGALPATFVYDGEGRLRFFREGMATFDEFREQVLDVLDNPSTKEKRS